MNGKTGQLTQVVNNLDRNKDRVYEFDALGRLIVAKGGGATGVSGVTANWTQSYGYDRYGNRTSVAASGITANNQKVPTDGLASLNYQNQSNQTLTNRITTAGYEYDAAGNQTRGQAPTGVWQRYQYDAAGRLVKVMDDNFVELESYAYGASRQRLKTSVPNGLTTYYAWGGSSVLCEYTETTNQSGTFRFAKSYIYAGSRLLSTQMWNGSVETTEFHHPDRLGTKLVTNNAAGPNIFYEQSTLPFGTSLDAEFIGTPTTNQRFTSYDRSDSTKLDYAVNRSYSSGQGRFSSVDPIGMVSSSITNPQSNNLYAYVENNPISYTDPSGLNKIAVFTCHRFCVDVGDGNPSCELDCGWEEIEIGGVGPLPLPGDPGTGGGGGGLGESPAKDFPCPPTINSLINNPTVRKYLDKAFSNSGHRTDSPLEAGGWIYQDKNGNLSFVEADSSRRKSYEVDLNNPPKQAGKMLIAAYHSHPYAKNTQEYSNKNPNDGFVGPFQNTGPSWTDKSWAERNQIPLLATYEAPKPNGNGSTTWYAGVGPERISNKGCR